MGLSSVRVQLAQADGSTVEAITEFDGTAAFDAVPLGSYQVQLDPKQAQRLRMRLIDRPSVLIRGGGSDTPDVTLQVRFEPAPPETTIAKSGGG